VVWLSAKDGDVYEAARAHLGALGIVVAVTFRVVPSFRLRTREYLMSSADFYAEWQHPSAQKLRYEHMLPSLANHTYVFSGDGVGVLASRHEFAKFWVIPYTDHTVVHAIDRVKAPFMTGSGPLPPPDTLPTIDPPVGTLEELNRYGTELLNLMGPSMPFQSQVNQLAAVAGFSSERKREGRSDRL